MLFSTRCSIDSIDTMVGRIHALDLQFNRSAAIQQQQQLKKNPPHTINAVAVAVAAVVANDVPNKAPVSSLWQRANK